MFKEIIILTIIAFVASSPDRSERIVGGRNAALGQVPYQASLRSFGTTFHFAGGVLISNRWVLTNAKNMVGRANNSIQIALGIVNLSASFTSRQSDTIEIHPFFDHVTMQNDIACVRAALTITFTQNIQPIFLVGSIIRDGTVAQVSGWGATDYDKGPNSDFLKLTSVITSSCDSNSTDDRTVNINSNICASAISGSAGFCTSDVGGPLVTPAGLIGIASWHRNPCATEPDVYVRISWFRHWIGSITGV